MRLFTFPFRIRLPYWVIVALLGMPRGEQWTQEAMLNWASWVIIVTVSILWHELGHAFAMKLYGYSPTIELHGMGGATSWGKLRTLPSAKERIAVSAAGPFAGFFLGFVVFAIGSSLELPPGPASNAYQTLLWVNVGWGIINLVPMLPWDGGHILEGFLDLLTKGKGAKPAAYVTIALAVFCAGAALLLLQGNGIWLAFLCGLSVLAGTRKLKMADVQAAAPTPAEPQELLRASQRWLSELGPDAIVTVIFHRQNIPPQLNIAGAAEEAAAAADNDQVRAELLETAGWVHLLANDPEAAKAALAALPESHQPSAELSALVAARDGDMEAALNEKGMLDPEVRRPLEALALALDGDILGAEAKVRNLTRASNAVEAALFYAPAYRLAAEFGAALYETSGSVTSAYNVACSHAQIGEIELGLEWLERAVSGGFDDLGALQQDNDLDPLRGRPEFDSLLQKVRASVAEHGGRL